VGGSFRASVPDGKPASRAKRIGDWLSTLHVRHGIPGHVAVGRSDHDQRERDLETPADAHARGERAHGRGGWRSTHSKAQLYERNDVNEETPGTHCRYALVSPAAPSFLRFRRQIRSPRRESRLRGLRRRIRGRVVSTCPAPSLRQYLYTSTCLRESLSGSRRAALDGQCRRRYDNARSSPYTEPGQRQLSLHV
jgi:hypothetical protein